MRLEGDGQLNEVPLQSFVSVDIWRHFSIDNSITFNDETVDTEVEGTSLEVRGGLTAQVADSVGLYGSVGYMTDLDSEEEEALSGTIGLRVRW